VSAPAKIAPVLTPTAIVHDWFQGMHGAERVVDAMRTGLFTNDAAPDIFTFYAAHDLLPADLVAAIRGESRIARLPAFRQSSHGPGRWKYLLPIMPLYFRHLDLSQYGLVISSSHSFALQARAAKDAVHVCYCHTPLRYAWLPGESGESSRGVTGRALTAGRGALRRIDLLGARQPDSFVANSEAVRERIQRFYGRDATVIHPPVDIDDFDPSAEKEPGHFLWVHRLVPHKRPEVVIEAFRELPYRLTMVGTGMLADNLRPTLPANVTLLDWVSREELAALYARSVGFIHIGEEDFGISMVEALAAGMPVIALNAGGARDIVRPGVDGILVDEATVDAVRGAVTTAAAQPWPAARLHARAHSFSRPVFLERFRAHLAELGVS
jgi:glycosyltransferase involved in cell wall biosynthesis